MDTETKDTAKATYAAPDGQESMTDTEDIVAAEEDDNSEDSLTFSNGVIEKIVALAVRDVPGVVGMKGGWVNRVQDALGATDPRKGVTVEVTPDAAVRVNISVLIEYGAYAPQIFEDVKKAVVKQVMGMTGLEVAGVNRNAKRAAEEEADADAESEAETQESEEDVAPVASTEPAKA